MSYRFKSEGVNELMKTLAEVSDKAEFIASMALYDGAGVMVKAIEKEANSIKTAPFKYAAGGEQRLPSPEEKEIVTSAGAYGIASFHKRLGSVDTSVGYNGSGYAPVNWNHMSSSVRTNYKAQSFKGYDNMTTSTLKFAGVYKRGVQNTKPIGVIANSINSGTSFMKKQPFMRRAVTKAAPEAERAIIEKGESLIGKIIQESEIGGKSA